MDKNYDLEYLIKFCRDYSNATYIPTSLRERSVVKYSFQAEIMDIKPSDSPNVYLYYSQRNGLEFCGGVQDILYGRIPVGDSDYDIYLGPVFPTGVTDDIVADLLKEQILPLEKKEALAEFIHHIPDVTKYQLARHMILVNRYINDEVLEASDVYGIDENLVTNKNAKEYELLEENELIDNTYKYDKGLMEAVKSGSESRLNSYLSAYSTDLITPSLASSALRNVKNQFITTATQLIYMAAIPTGVSIREAASLSNKYIRECENYTTIESIAALEYSMFKDFSRLCATACVPLDSSGEVLSCISYIRNHVTENISVADVADSVHRSSSYVSKLFSKELGYTINTFIMRCKLEEAKSLLRYTDMSLSEISTHLCFSSQSYFQNCFKKKFKVTPLQYRKGQPS